MPRATKVYGGLSALPAQLAFCLAVLFKRLFQARRYPLLFLSARRNGFLKTLRILARLRMTKVIRVGSRCHFSLIEPRWPSPAYDHLIARGGLNVAGAGTPAKLQIDLAILGVARACAYHCAHCYERFNIGGPEAVPVSRWQEVIRELQRIGVSVIALSGGEPLVRFDDTLELVRTTDQRRSDVHLFTTGFGATPERVAALVGAGLAAAGVGLDDHDPARYDALRGRKGAFEDALRALRLFADAGILTYVNTCLTRDLVRDDGLWRFYELLDGLGVGAMQLLEPKPCGGYAGRDLAALYGNQEKRAVRAFFESAQRSRRHRSHPAVFYPADMEAPENMGCMGGGLSHLHIDSLGNVEPCVFLPVSFGNVLREDFPAIYGRMRAALPRPLHARCPSLVLAERVGFSPDRQAELPVPYASIRDEWRRMYS